LSAEITIRPFADDDAPQVRDLFIVVNRLLSPPDLRDVFEAYIKRALAEEVDRISAYYGQRNGGFWVAIQNDKLVGTFGLERASPDAMELRRMYVDPGARRRGIARQMLRFAKDECRQRKVRKLELSTSESLCCTDRQADAVSVTSFVVRRGGHIPAGRVRAYDLTREQRWPPQPRDAAPCVSATHRRSRA
jgi:GNAT superfamily N-acetyltransferase